MAVISEVKCGRCDRRYSGFRGRCPYCGARRNKRGKHADEVENAKAKLIIGVLLLVVLIAATMILIFTSLPKGDPDASSSSSPDTSADASPDTSDPDSDVTTVEGSTEPEDSTSPEESTSSPSMETNVLITAVSITYGDAVKEDVTMEKIGEKLQFKYATTPEATDKVPIWDSSDDNVFTVLNDGTVTACGKGNATLTVTIDGVVGKCIIRVRGK
jgi:cytoskeletal protein RodZ